MDDVDGIATPSNFAEVVTSPAFVPVIIQYRSKVRGASIVTFGDSIWDAHNVTNPGNGFAWKAVLSMSTPKDPVELCSMCVPGATALQLMERAEAILPTLSPSLIAVQSASRNSFGSSLGSRTQQHGEGAVGIALALAAEYGSALLVGSMLPVKNSAQAWGATDAQRITLNAALASRDDDYTFIDFGPVIDGVAVSGQIEPKAEHIQGDGIHLNDLSHDALAPVFGRGIRQSLYLPIR